MYICIYVYIYIYIYIYICIYIKLYTLVTYIHKHAHTCTHTHIHTYTHTYIHTHPHPPTRTHTFFGRQRLAEQRRRCEASRLWGSDHSRRARLWFNVWHRSVFGPRSVEWRENGAAGFLFLELVLVYEVLSYRACMALPRYLAPEVLNDGRVERQVAFANAKTKRL